MMKKRVFLLVLVTLGSAYQIVAQLPSNDFSLPALLSQRERRASVSVAEDFIRKREYASAIPLLERWIAASPNDPDAAVHLARCYARTGRANECSMALQLAVANGLNDVEVAIRHPDFDSLRGSVPFRTFVEQTRLRKNDMFPAIVIPQRRFGKYRVYYPPGYTQANGKRYRLVVLLHGNGHNSEFMLSWGRGLGLDNCILVCPDAPYVKIRESITSFRDRYSAAAEGFGVPDSMMPDIVTLSSAWYQDVVKDAQQRFPVTLDKPVIIGFSQGGYYAHVVGTRYPETYGGIVSVCGSMYPEGKVLERYDKLRTYGVDVLVAHGRQDDVVPFQTAQLILGALESSKVNVVFVPFEGKHWPTPEVNAAIRQWIIERVK